MSRSSQSFVDYYALLGLPGHAGASEIKKAFHTAALLNHPDKFIDVDAKAVAEERMKAINAAYEVLGDPGRRRAYLLEYSKNVKAAKWEKVWKQGRADRNREEALERKERIAERQARRESRKRERTEMRTTHQPSDAGAPGSTNDTESATQTDPYEVDAKKLLQMDDFFASRDESDKSRQSMAFGRVVAALTRMVSRHFSAVEDLQGDYKDILWYSMTNTPANDLTEQHVNNVFTHLLFCLDVMQAEIDGLSLEETMEKVDKEGFTEVMAHAAALHEHGEKMESVLELAETEFPEKLREWKAKPAGDMYERRWFLNSFLDWPHLPPAAPWRMNEKTEAEATNDD